MKIIYTILLSISFLTMLSCNKETTNTQKDVMKSLLVNKNWFLDYSITTSSSTTNPALVKSYVGQATYFVTYLKDGTTKDSDGLTGKYTIEIINNQSQIHIQLVTINGNPFEVIYDIVSVGDTKLVLSKVVSSGTPTQLFFTNK
jgi:hypothetical protein